MLRRGSARNMNEIHHNSRWPWMRHGFIFLLAMLFLLLVVAPFLEGFARLGFLFNAFLSAVLVSAVYALSQKIRNLAIAALLAIPMLISIWTQYFVQSEAIFLIGRICGASFIAFTIFHILRNIFQVQDVTKDTIAGGAAVYVLFALMWSFLYGVLEHVEPGSFAISASQTLGERNIFLYYSFVTITTLGYGDIMPVTYIASSLAVLEAVVGQLYLVVLVAWLVGMYVSKKSKLR
jgi:voltage-gated potassium channel